MKKILLASAAMFAMAGVAAAADLPARMPVKAPPVLAPAFSWTGCYIGGHVGGAWSGDDAVLSNSAAPQSISYSLDSSFIGGGTLGCNWQPVGSAFVLGLEGEAGYMSVEGTYSETVGIFTSTATSKVGDWYGMITGRLGYAVDRTLIYAKGGVAFVDVETTLGSNVFGSFSTKDTVATWTVGGGIEWAFAPSWSIKGEYMYIGLDETQTMVVFGQSISNQIDGIHTAKVGLNYRFGGGAPLVARY
ncbi:outer membrane beta-barrel protein [Rhodoplanes sp. TEM]|uniref:Outer membrane beta-barrel protein n=1 Tax=Rhodoplanes tepidamans TaxID=200616 RepID=A0ABT5JJS5_RHOTP|nr:MULTISPECIES: outer membrane beta-barrel protein [Rhodoplanes]MDC7789559.1 outer membrane beta-barrel protein [Rhodoplanes tepidamans]MDC7986734.1 outer membrane beta-barrel protein [Rhodoplanes sp. TEM]MDQ0359152.1 outer membrane immunogenic protein [Rhodoplanes tepidamans]